MAKEYTLSILKPDALRRNLCGAINKILEENGLAIVAQKMVKLSEEQAKQFYAEHKERPFFGELVSYMVSAPVVLQVLEGEDAIAKNREIMGATNPKDAAATTIRGKYGISIEENSVHGSDSAVSAKKEIDLFFSSSEIYKR